MFNLFKNKKPLYIVKNGFVLKRGRYCLMSL